MSCCTPSREGDEPIPADRPSGLGEPAGRPAGTVDRTVGQLIHVDGGEFTMGEGGPMAYPADGEDPQLVRVHTFSIAATAVTNDAFATFVAATGYVTDAERFGWSFVFGGLLPDDFPDTRGVAAAPWWRQVYGATWRHPEGPHSEVSGRGDHPVVQVSHADALAFAAWSGTRLSTEAEWEFAARAGSTTTFPWGDELEPGGEHLMNVFQGEFPGGNTAADGWTGTCPVTAYEPNAWGLHNMVGNVWEWTQDRFAIDRFGGSATTDGPDGPVITNPTGARTGDQFVLKGGSYLCHASYCRRYRPAARMSSTPDSAAGNIGFRVAAPGGST